MAGPGDKAEKRAARDSIFSERNDLVRRTRKAFEAGEIDEASRDDILRYQEVSGDKYGRRRVNRMKSLLEMATQGRGEKYGERKRLMQTRNLLTDRPGMRGLM